MVQSPNFSAGITPNSGPDGIAAGPDGNLWFTENAGGRIGRITPSGTITEFSAGITPNSAPDGITAGPDGNLWFTENFGGRIGRITPSGTVTEFSAGISFNSGPAGITAGPDGNLWFTEESGGQIGRITTGGTVTEFSAGITPNSGPVGITAGPDGNLWFTEESGGQIGRITTGGTVTEFSTGITFGSVPTGITPGPDGNLWFTEAGSEAGPSQIGRITTGGTVTEFSAGITPNSGPAGITAGPDGNIWFTEHLGDQIGRVLLSLGLTITPASPLPTITDQVILDGTSERTVLGLPTVGPPVIQINGNVLSGDGLVLGSRPPGPEFSGTSSAGSTILGLDIYSFKRGSGIHIRTNDNKITENFLGTDVNGAAAGPGNNAGVSIDTNTSGNTIGGTAAGAGNVISGNSGDGIDLLGGGNFVQGNKIGTNAAGTAALGNGTVGSGAGGAGVRLVGTSNTIANNVISGNVNEGVFTTGGGNMLLSNLIGTNAAGTAALGNGLSGITLQASAANTISGNVLSGNGINTAGGSGIVLFGSGAHSNLIVANDIGTDVTGSAPLPNHGAGVLLTNGAINNTIGGTGPGVRNVISGNIFEGIVASAAPNNSILGNFVGTNAAGTAALGNGGAGIRISQSAANTISGNVIAGAGQFGGDGIRLTDPGTDNNLVQANFIGTDKTGSVALGNSHDGVLIQNGAKSNTIGGGSPGTGNVISGNFGHGVEISGTGTTSNLVTGNRIGTTADGNAPLPNQLDGIFIGSGATANTIGGPDAAAGNLISGNNNHGIEISGTATGGGEILFAATSGNVIASNIIGLNINGSTKLGNGLDGLMIFDASDTIVGPGNVISGNGLNGQDAAGVNILGTGTQGTRVFENLIGTDITGGAALGNSLHGVFVGNGATGTIVGPRNVISGNGLPTNQGVGVYLFGSTTTGNLIIGNLIGTDRNGAVGLNSTVIGVLISQAPGNVVQNNLISGNQFVGVEIASDTASNNQVIGNLIGTDLGGTKAIPNGLDGVFINNATNNTIGGTATGAGNLISGNGSVGIQLFGPLTTGNVIEGNALGLNSAGQPTLLNPAGGIFVNTGPQSNQIGGTAPGQQNRGQIRPKFSVSGFHQSRAASRKTASTATGHQARTRSAFRVLSHTRKRLNGR